VHALTTRPRDQPRRLAQSELQRVLLARCGYILRNISFIRSLFVASLPVYLGVVVDGSMRSRLERFVGKYTPSEQIDCHCFAFTALK
jgi:hypothetical protein